MLVYFMLVLNKRQNKNEEFVDKIGGSYETFSYHSGRIAAFQGKTSVLKVSLFALGIINNEPINHIEVKVILRDIKEVKLNAYFFY